MRINRSFDWLGSFPLAVDMADTVRLVQGEEVEMLSDHAALASWVTAELPRFPDATAALGHLPDVIELRDAVRDVLLAHAQAHTLPSNSMRLLNDASARCPGYPIVDGDGNKIAVELNGDAFDVFRAQVARSAFEVLGQERTHLSVCQAPSCGMLFVRGSRRQRWCSAQCGNRARVARHAARSVQGAT